MASLRSLCCAQVEDKEHPSTGKWSINERGSCVVLWSVRGAVRLYELRLELPYRTTAEAVGAGSAGAFAVLFSRPNTAEAPFVLGPSEAKVEKRLLDFWTNTVWSLYVLFVFLCHCKPRLNSPVCLLFCAVSVPMTQV